MSIKKGTLLASVAITSVVSAMSCASAYADMIAAPSVDYAEQQQSKFFAFADAGMAISNPTFELKADNITNYDVVATKHEVKEVAATAYCGDAKCGEFNGVELKMSSEGGDRDVNVTSLRDIKIKFDGDLAAEVGVIQIDNIKTKADTIESSPNITFKTVEKVEGKDLPFSIDAKNIGSLLKDRQITSTKLTNETKNSAAVPLSKGHFGLFKGFSGQIGVGYKILPNFGVDLTIGLTNLSKNVGPETNKKDNNEQKEDQDIKISSLALIPEIFFEQKFSDDVSLRLIAGVGPSFSNIRYRNSSAITENMKVKADIFKEFAKEFGILTDSEAIKDAPGQKTTEESGIVTTKKNFVTTNVRAGAQLLYSITPEVSVGLKYYLGVIGGTDTKFAHNTTIADNKASKLDVSLRNKTALTHTFLFSLGYNF